jgi:hypothetical protein
MIGAIHDGRYLEGNGAMWDLSERSHWFKVSLSLAIGILAFSLLQVAAPGQSDPARDVQAVFERSCYACHSSNVQMGGLRLDSKSTALAGGMSGNTSSFFSWPERRATWNSSTTSRSSPNSMGRCLRPNC